MIFISRFFPDLNDEENQTIAKIIQFIFDNGHIQKLPYSKLILSSVGDWLEKDFVSIFLYNSFKNINNNIAIPYSDPHTILLKLIMNTVLIACVLLFL